MLLLINYNIKENRTQIIVISMSAK